MHRPWALCVAPLFVAACYVGIRLSSGGFGAPTTSPLGSPITDAAAHRIGKRKRWLFVSGVIFGITFALVLATV